MREPVVAITMLAALAACQALRNQAGDEAARPEWVAVSLDWIGPHRFSVEGAPNVAAQELPSPRLRIHAGQPSDVSVRDTVRFRREVHVHEVGGRNVLVPVAGELPVGTAMAVTADRLPDGRWTGSLEAEVAVLLALPELETELDGRTFVVDLPEWWSTRQAFSLPPWRGGRWVADLGVIPGCSEPLWLCITMRDDRDRDSRDRAGCLSALNAERLPLTAADTRRFELSEGRCEYCPSGAGG